MPKTKKLTPFQPALKPLLLKTEIIMCELDGGYNRITDHDDPDKYPPLALTAWDDRNRYREYIGRVLMRLEKEGRI